MGREGDWTPAPPPPGGAGSTLGSTTGFSGGPQQNSGFPQPPGPNQVPPGLWGAPLGNNSGTQGGIQGQPLPPSSVSGGQPWSGPPAFRLPLSTGAPNAGPPGVRPILANSTLSTTVLGQGRGGAPPGRFGPPQQQAVALGGPPSNSGIRAPQQQSGMSSAAPLNNAAFRGAPVGPPRGAPPAPAGLNYSRPAPLQSASIPAQPSSSQSAAYTSMGPPQQRSQPGEFPGAPTAAPIPASGTIPGSSGPRGPPSGPPPSQLGGPSPLRSSGPMPPYGQSSVPLSAQFQNMNFGSQSQSGVSGPPRPGFGTPIVGVGEPAAPPAWQTGGQGVPQGSLRRVYPDAFGVGGPPTHLQGAAMPQGSGMPRQYPHDPAHLPPSMGHLPGVVDKYSPGIAGMSQPGSPATQNTPSGTSRIDPNQIPRPLPGATSIEFETRVNGQANLPPSATTNFVVRDTGNCSPRLMRSTLNQIPCTGDLLGTSGMPLAVMVQPFALPHPSEEPIQVVDFGESGPVRCSQCKAYVNHFMKFTDQGRQFLCNLCGFKNETPRDYHCNLGPDGRRRDADQRPELSKGTVEFVASKEYLVRPPMPAVYYFLVDVSSTAVQTGAVVAACSAINRALADLPEGPRTMVGIATFDSTIHYYSLNKNLQQAAMLVVPEIQDVYTPLQSDLIVPLLEVREHLEQLLESIPSMFQNNRIPEAAFGAAIKGAFLAMKSTGGKLLVFQSVLPSIGIGALTPRESEGRVSGEKEYLKLLQPSDKILKTMAIEFAEFQVCVELFIMSQQYVDITSLSVVPQTTGGQAGAFRFLGQILNYVSQIKQFVVVYYYHPFSAVADSAKLYNDIRWNVTRPQGMEAVMRVRCSQGLQVQEYYGHFCKRIPTDVDLPAIDCDKTIMVTFKHDDKFQDGAECCFQCALLYTTLTGERRIRVITLSLSCTALLSNLFRGADLDAQFTYLLKHAAQEVPNVPLSQVRDQITSQCVNILYTYRKFCATASSSGQLILPEALKLLPLYTLALIKSIGLRTDARSDTHVDERAYWLSRVASLPASLSIPVVYPRMFAIHNLPSQEALGGAILPPVVPLSSENLDQDGVFLLEMGEDAYLYVGKQAPVELVQHLLGVNSVDAVVSGQFVLPSFENESSRRLNEIVNEIRRQRYSYLRLRLLRRGDPLEFLFFSFLVEDKSSSGWSYVEFLVHVHRQIQNKMT